MAKPGPKPRIRIEPVGANEWQDWHLTPTGWVEGSQKLDCMPRLWKLPIPRSRVLTCRVGDRLLTLWDQPEFYIRERWRTKQKTLLETAVAEHGKWPPDFRIETLKSLKTKWLPKRSNT